MGSFKITRDVLGRCLSRPPGLLAPGPSLGTFWGARRRARAAAGGLGGTDPLPQPACGPPAPGARGPGRTPAEGAAAGRTEQRAATTAPGPSTPPPPPPPPGLALLRDPLTSAPPLRPPPRARLGRAWQLRGRGAHSPGARAGCRA